MPFTTNTANPQYYTASGTTHAWPFEPAPKPPQLTIQTYWMATSRGVPEGRVYMQAMRWKPKLYGDGPTALPTNETVARQFKDEYGGTGLKLLAWETDEDFNNAIWSGIFGTGTEFMQRRATFLVRKEKGQLHPTNSNLHAVDKVFWVEDDPCPVDGAPTLFFEQGEAETHAARCFPNENGEQIKNRVKSRKVFTLEAN